MLDNIKGSLAKFAPVYTALVVTFTPALAFAEGTAVSSSSFSGVISAITSQVSISTVAEVLTYAAGIAITLVFFWWGVRKALRMLMASFRKGRMSV